MSKKREQERQINCPFIGPDGQIHSPFRAILDRCIIWPVPPPERIGDGVIEIPQTARDQFQDSTGILLSVGPGYWGKEIEGGPQLLSRLRMRKPGQESSHQVWHPTTDQLKPGVRVYYDNSVPWGVQGVGLDGKTYNLVICLVADLQGIVS